MPEILGDWEALIAEIRRRAQHRALEQEDAANKRCEAILKAAAEQHESILRQLEQEGDVQVAALTRHRSARGELDARRQFAILREQPIAQVFRDAEARLRAVVHEPQYLEILRDLALRAARELDGGNLILAADPVGHALLTAEVLETWSVEANARFSRAAHPADVWGGLVATRERTRFDATFPTRLATARSTMRERVFAKLTEEAHP